MTSPFSSSKPLHGKQQNERLANQEPQAGKMTEHFIYDSPKTLKDKKMQFSYNNATVLGIKNDNVLSPKLQTPKAKTGRNKMLKPQMMEKDKENQRQKTTKSFKSYSKMEIEENEKVNSENVYFNRKEQQCKRVSGTQQMSVSAQGNTQLNNSDTLQQQQQLISALCKELKGAQSSQAIQTDEKKNEMLEENTGEDKAQIDAIVDEGDKYLVSERQANMFLNKKHNHNYYSPFSPSENAQDSIKWPAYIQSRKKLLDLSDEQNRSDSLLSDPQKQPPVTKKENSVQKFVLNSEIPIQMVVTQQDIKDQQELFQKHSRAQENTNLLNKNNEEPLFSDCTFDTLFKMLNKDIENRNSQNSYQKFIQMPNGEQNVCNKNMKIQNSKQSQQSNQDSEIEGFNYLMPRKVHHIEQRQFNNQMEMENANKIDPQQNSKNRNNNAKQKEIEKQSVNEFFYKKVDKHSQELKREDNYINVSPQKKSPNNSFVDEIICSSERNIEQKNKNCFNDAIGEIENAQSDLQEQIQQNIACVDELNAHAYPDLNASFDSLDSDDETVYNINNFLSKPIKKIKPILEFCEEISQLTEIKPSFFIHSKQSSSSYLQSNLNKLNKQFYAIQKKQLTQDNAIYQIINHIQNEGQDQTDGKTRVFKSPLSVVTNSLDSIQKKVFQCKFCSKIFPKSCSLGGHISRVHKGKSDQYKEKQKIREKREMERQRKTHFKQKGFILNEEISNTLDESEQELQKNNKTSEKKFTDSTILKEDIKEQDYSQNQKFNKKSQNEIEEIYHPEEDDEDSLEDRDYSKMVTKKISKEKKRGKRSKIQMSNISKALFHNKQKKQ